MDGGVHSLGARGPGFHPSVEVTCHSVCLIGRSSQEHFVFRSDWQ